MARRSSWSSAFFGKYDARRRTRGRPLEPMAAHRLPVQHDDLVIDRLDLLCDGRSGAIADTVETDIAHASPETRVVRHHVEFTDAWDFEDVYGTLDFARTTVRSRAGGLPRPHHHRHSTSPDLPLPADGPSRPRSSPPDVPASRAQSQNGAGTYSVIDLDLSRYDQLASRFQREHVEGQSFLKSGIETKNHAFNHLIERIEHVAIASRAPILLTGPTGAGKSKLARRIFELRKVRKKIAGDFARSTARRCAATRR